MPGVRRQVDHRAPRMAVDGDLGVARETRGQVRREIARQVDVASLQQQPLGGRLRHVTQDDPLHAGRAVAVVGVGCEHHRLVGLPTQQPERTGAGAVGLEPRGTPVAVLLLGQHQLPVHHRPDAGRERVQKYAKLTGI